MATKKIYIVRHGETDFNRKGIVQGSGIDASINETGRIQAVSFYEAYKDCGFEKIYTSTLKRTKQSMAGFIDDGLPTEALHGLDEINWGEKEGKQVTSEDNKYYKHLITAWQNGDTALKIEGGESPDEVAERQRTAMEAVLGGPEEKLLICMHGRAIRILLCLMLNYPLKCMDNFDHTNLCLYQLVHTGTMFQLREANKTDHLNEV